MTKPPKTLLSASDRVLTAATYQCLATVPPEMEWFANLGNAATRPAYQTALQDFMCFTGIARPEEFRTVTRAHVIAWRDELAGLSLSATTIPQKLLSQSRFIHPDLTALFVELFNADVYGHLRRAQGFVRACTKEINRAGHETASVRIAAAIATMRRYNRYRVPYFEDLLAQARKQSSSSPEPDREIVRRPGNPMLRYAGGALQAVDADAAVPTIHKESLEL